MTWPPVPFLPDLTSPDYRGTDLSAPPEFYLYRAAGVSCSGKEGD